MVVVVIRIHDTNKRFCAALTEDLTCDNRHWVSHEYFAIPEFFFPLFYERGLEKRARALFP